MTLEEWKAQSLWTNKDIADALRVNPSTVSRWASGSMLPSGRQIVRIEQMTQGHVTAQDWTHEGARDDF